MERSVEEAWEGGVGGGGEEMGGRRGDGREGRRGEGGEG